MLTPNKNETSQTSSEFESLFDSIREKVAPFLQGLTNIAEAATRYIHNNPDFLKNLSEALEQIKNWPERQKELWGEAAQIGWFFNHETEIGLRGSGDIKDINAFMYSHIKNDLPSLVDEIRAQFPARDEYFQSAFEMHNQNKFSCSIPLLFTQIDGICHDLTGNLLFSDGAKRKDYIDKLKESDEDGIYDLFLFPIKKDVSPIFVRAEDFDKRTIGTK